MARSDSDLDGKSKRATTMDRSMKQLKFSGVDIQSKYNDTRFLVLTSTISERLFSVSGHATANRKKGVLSTNFECRYSLYVNQDMWVLRK